MYVFSCIQEEVDRLKSQGASESDQRQLLEQHERDLQNLVNKIDADKMRMQSTLQERLKKKKLERLLAKEKELKDNADENKREFEHKQNSQLQRMKADEVCMSISPAPLIFSKWACLSLNLEHSITALRVFF